MLGPIAQGSPVEPDIFLMIVQLTFIQKGNNSIKKNQKKLT